ncbi:MAG: hypothetical protein K2Y02_00400 [Burkholderiaceae bacterium]|nr:hypothetical protein [Burkholderiaceae bacterium]
MKHQATERANANDRSNLSVRTGDNKVHAMLKLNVQYGKLKITLTVPVIAISSLLLVLL